MLIRFVNHHGTYLLQSPDVVETSHGPAFQAIYGYLPLSGGVQGSEGWEGLFYLESATEIGPA